jgi:hypothetical protein
MPFLEELVGQMEGRNEFRGYVDVLAHLLCQSNTGRWPWRIPPSFLFVFPCSLLFKKKKNLPSSRCHTHARLLENGMLSQRNKLVRCGQRRHARRSWHTFPRKDDELTTPENITNSPVASSVIYPHVCGGTN